MRDPPRRPRHCSPYVGNRNTVADDRANASATASRKAVRDDEGRGPATRWTLEVALDLEGGPVRDLPDAAHRLGATPGGGHQEARGHTQCEPEGQQSGAKPCEDERREEEDLEQRRGRGHRQESEGRTEPESQGQPRDGRGPGDQARRARFPDRMDSVFSLAPHRVVRLSRYPGRACLP